MLQMKSSLKCCADLGEWGQQRKQLPNKENSLDAASETNIQLFKGVEMETVEEAELLKSSSSFFSFFEYIIKQSLFQTFQSLPPVPQKILLLPE